MTGLATSSGPTLLGKLRALESRIDESEKLFSRGPIGELADLLPQIIAEIERDAKDAGRYRHMRNAGERERLRLEHYASDALDSAIDAAKERT